MNVLALGHIAFLLEIGSARGETVRILGDPWLSDHAIGDLMGRFPRLRFDVAQDLGEIDAIFVSHSHTDHFDPYSLVRLWNESRRKPALILPESLAYLESLVREFLSGVEILWLRDEQQVEFRGVTLTGFFNPEIGATNEDDVMVLMVDSGRELFVDESDALLPFYDPEVREALSRTLANPAYESICFLTAKNGLDATMASLAAKSLEDRRERIGRSMERVYEDVEEIFMPFEGASDDLWANPRLVRLVGGQGMCYPQALGSDWNRVLFPIRLQDRVGMEREIAEHFEHAVSIEEFVPGFVHRIDGGALRSKDRAEWLELLDHEEDRYFDANCELFDDFPVAPIRDETRPREGQEARILDVMNTRFLPHMIGSRSPPVEHLLGSNGGEYRIRIRYGGTAEHEDREYRIGFDGVRFARADDLRDGDPDEFYWANDIEDFLDGRADEFSNFGRRPLPGQALRLWNTLGLPYLNSDLILMKLRIHFERAARGESPDDWALGLLSGFGRNPKAGRG